MGTCCTWPIALRGTGNIFTIPPQYFFLRALPFPLTSCLFHVFPPSPMLQLWGYGGAPLCSPICRISASQASLLILFQPVPPSVRGRRIHLFKRKEQQSSDSYKTRTIQIFGTVKAGRFSVANTWDCRNRKGLGETRSGSWVCVSKSWASNLWAFHTGWKICLCRTYRAHC